MKPFSQERIHQRTKISCLRRPDRTYPLIRLETPLFAEDNGEVTPAFKVCVRIKPIIESENLMHIENESYSMLDRHF
jgi:hypothetical protein